MSEAEREYKYKDPRGMQRLCGILMCIMGPLTAYTFTLDPAGMELDFMTLTHNQAVVYMGALGVVLVACG